jgi:hypothetical protein
MLKTDFNLFTSGSTTEVQIAHHFSKLSSERYLM